MRVARQVGEVLTHGASVAQVVVRRQVTRDGKIAWMASLDQIQSQRGEFTQGRADGSFDGLWPWEFWIGGIAVSGWMPRGWQCDPPAPVEFQQQGTGGHVFKPTRVGTPIPALSQFLRETIAVPLRVSSNQIPELVKVLLGESASLDQTSPSILPDYQKRMGRVQRNLTSDSRCALQYLSSYEGRYPAACRVRVISGWQKVHSCLRM